MGSRKTVQTVRNEGESEAKVRTSNAFAEESMSELENCVKYVKGETMYCYSWAKAVSSF